MSVGSLWVGLRVQEAGFGAFRGVVCKGCTETWLIAHHIITVMLQNLFLNAVPDVNQTPFLTVYGLKSKLLNPVP